MNNDASEEKREGERGEKNIKTQREREKNRKSERELPGF